MVKLWKPSNSILFWPFFGFHNFPCGPFVVCEIPYEFVFLAAGNAVGLEREEPRSCLVPEFTFVHVQFPRQPRLMLGLDFTLSCGFSISSNRHEIDWIWLQIDWLYPFHLLKTTFVTYILVTSGPSLRGSAPWKHLSLCKLQVASWPFTRASLSNYRPGIAPKRPTCVRLLWKHFLLDGLNILATSSSLQLSPVAKWCVVPASNLGLKLA